MNPLGWFSRRSSEGSNAEAEVKTNGNAEQHVEIRERTAAVRIAEHRLARSALAELVDEIHKGRENELLR